jgi:hypothetical protein
VQRFETSKPIKKYQFMQVRRRSIAQGTKQGKDYPIADPSSDPNNILEKIVWHKEREVAQMYDLLPLGELVTQVEHLDAPRDFLAALRKQRIGNIPTLIAEVKKASPSRLPTSGVEQVAFPYSAIVSFFRAALKIYNWCERRLTCPSCAKNSSSIPIRSIGRDGMEPMPCC